jgi:GT2 family glycosyltransferase
MSTNFRVTVIILNWNGREHLAACLPTLYAQTFTDFGVIVVDNGSTDGSVAWLQTSYPQVQLIQNSTNLGFAAANNQAICASQSEFVALLNNDTRLDPHWLAALVTAITANPQVGMCACKMLLADRPTVIDSAGIAIDRAGIAWGLTSEPTGEIFGASGGAVLYRRAMLEEIGLFDEDFFAYLEDVDLAWRAQWAGWQALYVPTAVVLHAHSATSQRIPHFKSRLLGRNKIWLLAKNYPFPHLLYYLPLILGYEIMSIFYALWQRRLHSALAGRLEALGQLQFMLHKRRTLIQRCTGAQIMAKLQPIAGPLTVLQRYLHVAHANRTSNGKN